MPTTAEPLDFLARDTIAAAFFGPVHDWREHAAGNRLMVDAILAGHDLTETLLLCATADEARGGQSQRAGAMEGLLTCLDTLQASGKAFSVRSDYVLGVAVLNAAGERRRALLRCTQPDRGADMLRLLLQAGRAAGPYLKRAEPAAAPAPTPPAPVQVSVALQLPEGPVPMAIVSQPATRSVQTVERDDADEIVRTVTETTGVANG